jgi:hypothetical protein
MPTPNMFFKIVEKSAISATLADNQAITGGRWVADMADGRQI